MRELLQVREPHCVEFPRPPDVIQTNAACDRRRGEKRVELLIQPGRRPGARAGHKDQVEGERYGTAIVDRALDGAERRNLAR